MKVPLHDILEELIGLGKIKSEKELQKVIDELEKLPDDFSIDLKKYVENSKKEDEKSETKDGQDEDERMDRMIKNIENA